MERCGWAQVRMASETLGGSMAGKRVKSQQRGLRSTLNEEERHELGALISAVERLLPGIRPRLEPVFIRVSSPSWFRRRWSE